MVDRLLVTALMLAALPIPSVRLNPQTLKEFQAYMEVADRSMLSRATAKTQAPLPPEGQPRIEPWDANGPRPLTDGLVHDWMATAFLPKAKVADVVAVLKDYDHYREIYRPDLVDIHVTSPSENTRKLTIRTVKRKVFTVTLEIDYDVEYRTFPNGREQIWSRSTRIREVENAGTASETLGSAERNAGLLWRLNTYWQLEERDGGVVMECRAISLTRDIPLAAAWVIKPLITALPRESLTNLMAATRAAVEARLGQRASAQGLPRR